MSSDTAYSARSTLGHHVPTELGRLHALERAWDPYSVSRLCRLPFRDDFPPGPFDLIHARALLEHHDFVGKRGPVDHDKPLPRHRDRIPDDRRTQHLTFR